MLEQHAKSDFTNSNAVSCRSRGDSYRLFIGGSAVSNKVRSDGHAATEVIRIATAGISKRLSPDWYAIRPAAPTAMGNHQLMRSPL